MLVSKYPIEYTYFNGVVKCNLTIEGKMITDDWLENWDHYHIKDTIVILYFVGSLLEVQQEIVNAENDNFRRPIGQDIGED